MMMLFDLMSYIYIYLPQFLSVHSLQVSIVFSFLPGPETRHPACLFWTFNSGGLSETGQIKRYIYKGK